MKQTPNVVSRVVGVLVGVAAGGCLLLVLVRYLPGGRDSTIDEPVPDASPAGVVPPSLPEAERVARVESLQGRLRETAKRTSSLYRDLAAARKEAMQAPEVMELVTQLEQARTGVGDAFSRVAGVPLLERDLLKLRDARAALMVTSMVLRKKLPEGHVPESVVESADSAMRATIEALTANQNELARVAQDIGGINRQIESLKQTAWQSDAGLAARRQRVIELEHLVEGAVNEQPNVAQLLELQQALVDEARRLADEVAALEGDHTPRVLSNVRNDTGE